MAKLTMEEVDKRLEEIRTQPVQANNIEAILNRAKARLPKLPKLPRL